MTFKLGSVSLSRLQGLHPDLVRVVLRAIEITSQDFGVTEGLRTRNRQKYLVATGKSKTLKSRHLDGHAVDLAPYVGGEIVWDWPHFTAVVDAMRRAAKELNIPIEHGADWKSFPDGPHHQLPWAQYPSKPGS